MAATRKPASKRPWRTGVIRLLKIALVAALVGLVALVVAVGIAMSTLPSYSQLKSSPNGQMIRVRAADGTVLVSLGPSFGQWLTYDDIPPVMIDAMVAVEDRRFRSHPGVDPIGIARSSYVRLQRGAWAQGGSTITQQLARNVFLNNTKTFGRKGREMILALAMERKFSKDQILELYLNKVYFGGGAYGIDAASRKFFGHPATALSLEEAAIIAGLVKAPSHYSPTADTEAAVGRAEVVLDVMRDAGAINAEQAAAAQPGSVKFAPEPKSNSVRYFTDWALPQLDTLISERKEPLEVWTTLDLGMQRAADAAIRGNVPGGAQGALVALDRDGSVRAMVGGTDYVNSIYNRATQSQRQPGSAFKLFVYLAALEAGYTPDSEVVDEPVTINGWSPRNSSGRYSGKITLRTAFAYSINTVAAKIGVDVGTATIAEVARRFGIGTPLNTQPSMVLGTADVRLIDMTRAFASISAKGVAVTPFGITKVTTADRSVLYEHRTDTSRVLVAPAVAAQMTDLMQTAVATGTGRAAQIGRPVAGKTGTTSSNKDGWFLGFSSGITTGVWMGRDDAKAVGGLQGGRAPAGAFRDFMKVAVANRPVERFDTEVTLPEWQLEPDEEAYFGNPDMGAPADDNGMPGDPAAPLGDGMGMPDETEEGQEAPERIDRDWVDRMTRSRPTERDSERDRDRERDRERPAPSPTRAPPPRFQDRPNP
ncbi:penicillin-binding protein 1A [Sphingomonas zeicaulis]|uniref:transglycosylase domain-containing protein n=1 Tax=Sphingomonas zeicaulis TaxID=1632740 RepID=UPI003D22709A